MARHQHPRMQRSRASRPLLQRSPVRFELRPEHLRWRCTPKDLGVSTPDEAEPVTEIIGQDRALRSLRVGLEMVQQGYNVFVTGASGTGRTTTIKQLLREFEQLPAQLTDKCYVYNFRDPDAPRMIILPAGQGVAFKKDMENFLNELIKGIPALFESRRYHEQRKATLEHFQERQRSVLRDLEKKVKERGFEVVQVQTGATTRPEIAPVEDGNPVTLDQLHAKVLTGELSKERFEQIAADQAELERLLDNVMREMRNIERKAKKSAEQLSYRTVVPLVEELIADLEEKYPSREVHEYLLEVKDHVLNNLPRFSQHEDQPSVFGLPVQREEDRFLEFQVNVIVDNSTVKGRPVIIETNPRYKNLFGTIERVVDRNGVWRADFTHIKAGSLLKADGGYLVLNAEDALVEPGVWTSLKRVLRHRKLDIQPPETGLFGSYLALKPEPIDVDVKVLMIGDPYTYTLLYELDDDFKKIFKIRADFDTEMPNVEKAIASYVSFIKRVCTDEHLLPFELSAMCEVVEFGARLAGRQKKLSTRFTVIADVIRESDYWARKDQATTVSDRHVRKAIDERIERVRLIEEKIQEMILDGTLRVDTQGAVVGQVNGLSVYETSGYSFGKPSRITAKTAMGRAGIVNIEREADLSGPSHDKGVLILSGYMRDRYAKNKPLVLSASIAFEQSYSGVDGDSAASTEVYALLSSLSGLPIRQDIAVTGSVDQAGNIQAIGGVNQKIEGFFDVCKARGLTGTQGVLIPEKNAQDLMLRHDVVEAVRQKKFHIYCVKTIDEGIEILFGKPAAYVHRRVDAQLTIYAKRVKKFG
jgi:lon-related putative ATP-dependent protease